MSIPPLAGICTYEEATKPGFSVEENVALFLRYAWIEKWAMEAGLYWLNPTPEWEVKEAFSLHLYLDAEHAGMFRQRVGEMRNPPPRMDVSPSAPLDAFLNELLAAQDTLERVVGLYGVLKTALLNAYQEHYKKTNPIVDHPTRRLLRTIILEEEEALAWGQAAIAALTQSPADQARAEQWAAHLHAFLQAAGGISGSESPPESIPASKMKEPFAPDYFPQRDERFLMRWNFVFPPHEVSRTDEVTVEEKTLALMCKRALEMDVPEAMAPMIAEAKDQPWEYYIDMCRQLWDEARHAMMGTIYFEHHGIDWRKEIALHVGFSLRLNLELEPLEAHTVLYAIEQGLMPAKTGKRYEWETTIEALDPLATLFQDYDWADEVLHAQIGRHWLLPEIDMNSNEAMAFGREVIAKSLTNFKQYEDRGEQRNWWPDFVRKTLGRETDMTAYQATVATSG